MIVMVYFPANTRLIVYAGQVNTLVFIKPFALKCPFVMVDIIK
ncbi:hypothetical protein KPK_A0134 (plasmid) [Klebsiella variicola]|uniref:Uncharacterized protein n=1 Tax=Klebsiella variicola (strain 342) TaxID=507522 RepID=B5RK58_KLEV3|nr:hypothetical protein KPK_A0134 [Klebsiella variicola]